MATHDYVISNGTGSAVRSDINGALAAIVSQNSNASAPATTYAYMSWADTSAGVMKMRNGANSAWISLYELDGTFLASDISLAAGSAAAPSLFFTGDTNTGLFSPGADTVALATAGSNRLHITSGGNVGIGTTGPTQKLTVDGSIAINAGYLIPYNGATLTGYIGYGTSIGTANDIAIRCETGSILFGSSTERVRIDSSGRLLVGTTNTNPVSNNVAGVATLSTGQTLMSADAITALFINRITDDGNLIDFYQGGITEGTISVSGTTVSYNGAHLSRWSQLLGGATREEILRGTVLSNIDEMCSWGDEENEQLNRMKVSDVEGDKNVSGVFQCWDDDDDTYTDDFYCAMTGDFIIRIAEGVTVEPGDLLMSAGDGTAKPQDDDIIRSKTVAKVTSTHVTCTYEDGSYCVPCVLMAC